MIENEEMIWHVVSCMLANLRFNMEIQEGNMARKQYEENDVMWEILKCLAWTELQASE